MVGWIIIIVVGALMTSWSEGLRLGKLFKNKSLGLFFATTVLYAIATTFSKPALQEMDSFNYTAWWNVVQIPLLLCMFLVLNEVERSELKKKWIPTFPWALIELIFLYGSVIMMNFALTFSVSLTEALVTTQGVFAIAIGFFVSQVNPELIAENHTNRVYLLRFIGSLIILAGVYNILV